LGVTAHLIGHITTYCRHTVGTLIKCYMILL